MKTGVELIAEERAAVIRKRGATEVQDIKYKRGELVQAAILLLSNGSGVYPRTWDRKYEWHFRNKSGIEALQAAGQLVAAEIDRIQAITALNGKEASSER